MRGLRGTRTFHLFHLFCKFPWIFAWFGFVGVALLVCLFLLAFAFGEICFLSSLIPVVDRQCLALVRQCRKKKSKGSKSRSLSRSTTREASCGGTARCARHQTFPKQWPGGLRHPGAEPQAGLPTRVHPNAWHCLPKIMQYQELMDSFAPSYAVTCGI